MKFDDWLTAHKVTSAEFARVSGIGDRQAVHKYRHGERFPTPENLRRIRESTKGAVTADDFVDQHTGIPLHDLRPDLWEPPSAPKTRAQCAASVTDVKSKPMRAPAGAGMPDPQPDRGADR